MSDAASEYALAAAARPALGTLGFTMVGIAALLSTFSAVNATIYGNGRLAFVLAKEGELPEVFERRVWNHPVGAVLATGVFALLVANFLEVTEIAIVASAGFLMIFTVVNLAALRLSREIRISRPIAALSALATGGALIVLLLHASGESPISMALIGLSWVGCLVAEFLYQRATGRSFSIVSARGSGTGRAAVSDEK